MTLITDFPATVQTNNVPGIVNFEFVPIGHISSFPDLVVNNTITTAVSFFAGKTWLKGRAIANTLLYSEKTKGPNTPYFATLKGQIAKSTASTNQLFTALKTGLYIIKLTNKNGDTRLLGTLEFPFQFQFEFDTDKAIYSYEFTTVLPIPAPFYTG